MNIEPPTLNPEQLKSWLPVDALIDRGQPALKWIDFSDVVLSEPFFHETVARIVSNQKAVEVLTGLEALLQLEKISDSLSPSGFIFHSSRCGSTLLANACRALEGSIVVSEAQSIDKLISRFFTDAEPGSPKELLYTVLVKAVISAFGQRRAGNERLLFLKFACTTSLQMNRLRKIFPDVPFVFLYRHPVEVMVSNLQSRPEWMKPESNPAAAAAITGLHVDELNETTPEEFCARALGRFYDAALSELDPHTLLLNYSELSSVELVDVVRRFGVVATPEESAAIQEASRLYSKDVNQRQAFQTDSNLKRTSASELAIEMAEKWAMPAYLRLKEIRKA